MDRDSRADDFGDRFLDLFRCLLLPLQQVVHVDNHHFNRPLHERSAAAEFGRVQPQQCGQGARLPTASDPEHHHLVNVKLDEAE